MREVNRVVLSYLVSMLIPLYILIYTIQFGRWLHRKKELRAAWSAYTLGAVSFISAGFALWRILI